MVILNFIAPPSVLEGTYTQRGLNLPKAAGKWVGSEWTVFAGWGIRTGFLGKPVFVWFFFPLPELYLSVASLSVDENTWKWERQFPF